MSVAIDGTVKNIHHASFFVCIDLMGDFFGACVCVFYMRMCSCMWCVCVSCRAVCVCVSDKDVSLRVVADHSIVEIFVQGGRLAHTLRMYATAGMDPTTVTMTGTGKAKVIAADVYEMSAPTPDPELEALAHAANANARA